MTPWKHKVGERGSSVTAQERPDRDGVVYLTWYDNGKPKSQSLGVHLRDARGKLDPQLVRTAVAAAQQQVTRLQQKAAGLDDFSRLAVSETETVVTNPRTGKYPADTMHRREVLRSLRFAVSVWGKDRTWASLKRADLRQLWRAKLGEMKTAGHDGVRGAEIVLARILAIARWLKDEELIPVESCVPERRWKYALREDWKALRGTQDDPAVHRPRHTVEELRKILEVAPQVDPRFALMLQLGAELRLGQVRRLRRSQVSYLAREIQIPSSGRKKGAKLALTTEQQESLDRALGIVGGGGYLRNLEGRYQQGFVADYPLFPAGKLKGWRAEGGKTVNGKRQGHRLVRGELRATLEHAERPAVSRTAVMYWFREAEALAGIQHRDGRGAYGLRRAGVDGAIAAGVDPATLEQFGGWTDSQVPQTVYRDREHQQARERARDVRAKVRGTA